MKFTRPLPPQAISLEKMDIHPAITYWFAATGFADKLKTQSHWCFALMFILPWPLHLLFNDYTAIGASVFFFTMTLWSLLLSQKTRTEAAAYDVVSPEVMRDLIPSGAEEQAKYRRLLIEQDECLLQGQADNLRREFATSEACETLDTFLKNRPLY